MTLCTVNVMTLGAAAALLFAALHDIGFRTIPDWVPAVLATDGVLLRLANHDLSPGLICGLAVFMLAAVCWWRGWLGGGDVKLLGATAMVVPPVMVPGYIAAVTVAGGGLALVYLVLERIVPARRPRRAGSLRSRIMRVEWRRIRRRLSLPYATAITAAALLTLAKG